ncbi:hypothetical protein ACHAQA_003844 [Verticillium albo-atrum]
MVSALPRYRRIGDEPLYCEADPAQVLYKGSDDEDYPDPSVRKYKYEAAAVKFLEGKKPFILSATLRGPFDAASGWTNPWRSKGRLVKQPRTSHTPTTGAAHSGISQSTAKLRSIRHSIEDSFAQKAVARASSSCHLPSPESLDRAEQHPYLDEDELVKLESWRSRVQPVKPSVDNFWAPTKSFPDSTNTRKRRAQDSGWLRRTTLKRRRTDGDFDELDDLDNVSIMAQGFGMSQNTTIPILAPPEAEVEDELNINATHSFQSPRSSQSPQRKSPTRLGLLTSPVRVKDDTESDDELSGPSQSSQKPRTWRAASCRSQVSTRRQASEARSARSNASRRFIRQGTTTPSAKSVPVAVEDEAPEFETQQDDSFVYRARTKRADDISDFTSLGSRPEELPSAAYDISVESLATGLEYGLDDEVGENETTPVAPRSVEITDQPRQALGPPLGRSNQAVESFADDASFNSSDSESQAAVSVDEVIPSSQPAFDSSTLVECTTIKSANGSPKVGSDILQCPREEETVSIEESMSDEEAEGVSTSEDIEERSQPPMALEPSSPEANSIAQIGYQLPTIAVEADEDLGEEGAEPDFDAEFMSTSGIQEGMPDTEISSASLQGDENGTVPVATSSDYASTIPLTIAPVNMMVGRLVERAHAELGDHMATTQPEAYEAPEIVNGGGPQSPCRESQHPAPPVQAPQELPADMSRVEDVTADGLVALSQQSPWKGGLFASRQITTTYEPAVSSTSVALSHDSSPLLATSQQTPWKHDQTLPPQGLFNSRTAPPEESPRTESQSPWARSFGQMRQVAQHALHTASVSIMGSFTREAQHTTEQEINLAVSDETNSLHTAPSTPTRDSPEPAPAFTLKPFADFKSPPQPSRRKSRIARISNGRLPGTQSILLDTSSKPWGASLPRSNKRVSWCSLPNEVRDGGDGTPVRPRRAASPPPEQALDDLPTGEVDPFHSHFSAIKQKVKGHRHRILPTASQQVLRSPSPTAMADAFVAADELAKASKASTTSSGPAIQVMAETVDFAGDNGSESGDDVADVLMNLDSFIDAMDVEADVKQAKAQAKTVLENHNPFLVSGGLDAGVWDD